MPSMAAPFSHRSSADFPAKIRARSCTWTRRDRPRVESIARRLAIAAVRVMILTLKNRILSPAIERFIESMRDAAKPFAKPTRHAAQLSKPNVP